MSGGPLPDAATFLLANEVCPRCLGYRKDGMPGPHSCSDQLPASARGGDRRWRPSGLPGVEIRSSIESVRKEAAARLALLVLERLWIVPEGWKGDDLIGPVERREMLKDARCVLGVEDGRPSAP